MRSFSEGLMDYTQNLEVNFYAFLTEMLHKDFYSLIRIYCSYFVNMNTIIPLFYIPSTQILGAISACFRLSAQ